MSATGSDRLPTSYALELFAPHCWHSSQIWLSDPRTEYIIDCYWFNGENFLSYFEFIRLVCLLDWYYPSAMNNSSQKDMHSWDEQIIFTTCSQMFAYTILLLSPISYYPILVSFLLHIMYACKIKCLIDPAFLLHKSHCSSVIWCAVFCVAYYGREMADLLFSIDFNPFMFIHSYNGTIYSCKLIIDSCKQSYWECEKDNWQCARK